MRLTLSVIKADIGSIGGHICPSQRQGFFGAAMLPMSELEYTGIVEKLKTLEERFTVRV